LGLAAMPHPPPPPIIKMANALHNRAPGVHHRSASGTTTKHRITPEDPKSRKPRSDSASAISSGAAGGYLTAPRSMLDRVRPTRRDVLLLVSFQLGGGVIAAVASALLPGDSGVGMTAVGLMVGAHAFAHFKQSREPGCFVGSFAHWLAVWAAVAQIAIGVPILAVVVTTQPEVPFGMSAGTFLLVVTAITGPLVYGVTRMGFRLALRFGSRAKTAEPK